jgi:ABC-2 type transport system permease protein
MSYGVDGLRAAFIGLSHFGVVTDLIVLTGVAVVFLSLGARAFSRIQI